MRNYIIYIFIFWAGISFTHAQSDSVEHGNITIYRPYKPKLMEAVKKMMTPLPETAQVSMPVFSYKSIPVEPQYQITTPNYKAIGLPQSPLNKLYGNFAKIGFGNINSPYIELSYNNLRSKTWSLSANGRHYSLNGKDLNKKYSNNQLQLNAIQHGSKSNQGIGVLYNRDVFRYYHVNSSQPDTLNSNDIKNPFQNIGLNLYTQSRVFDSTKTNYLLDLNFEQMNRSTEIKELDFNIHSSIDKIVQGNLFHMNFSMDFDQYHTFNEVYNRNFFKLQPEYHMSAKQFKAVLGFNAILQNQNRDTINPNLFQFYPKLMLSYDFQKKLRIYGGINGDWKKYTLKSVSQINPFISKSFDLDNYKTFNINIGVTGNINKNLDISFEAKYLNYDNLLTYQMDTTLYRSIQSVYLTAAVKQLSAGIHYHLINKLDVHSNMNYHIYTLSNTFLSKASQLPILTWNNEIVYQLENKIKASLQLNFMGTRYSEEYDRASKLYQTIKLKPYTDINFHIDYRYTKFVSTFLQVNNIINNQYVRWYNYPVVGINVQLGLTIIL